MRLRSEVTSPDDGSGCEYCSVPLVFFYSKFEVVIRIKAQMFVRTRCPSFHISADVCAENNIYK